ncbi:MAG: hypothetical protein HN580_23910 [Deltaproteobacteria bacterium]|nr:hypothetical protein [Deltaproteobacteria bacterium]
MTMIKYLNLLVWCVLSTFLLSTVVTQAVTASESQANGIVKLNDRFQIFPDSKLGNTIYLNNKKLVSRGDLTLIDIVAAPEGYVYHGLDENGNSVLGYTGDQDAKFIQLPGGLYQLILSSIRKKKIYWINGKRQIEDLLPRRNTGTGLVYNNVDKAAFYHIAKGETIETEDGKERYQYTFRLHVVNTQTYKVMHLPISIKDFSLKLRLEWMDEDTIKYTLSNGQIETTAVQ